MKKAKTVETLAATVIPELDNDAQSELAEIQEGYPVLMATLYRNGSISRSGLDAELSNGMLTQDQYNAIINGTHKISPSETQETLQDKEEARLVLARKLIAIDETESTYNQVYNVSIGGLDCGKVGPALSRAKAVRHAMITHGIKSASIVQVSRFDAEQGINATMTFFDCEVTEYYVLKYRDRQWQL